MMRLKGFHYRQNFDCRFLDEGEGKGKGKGKCKDKINVNFTLEHGTKAQRGSRCIALLFLQLRRQMGKTE